MPKTKNVRFLPTVFFSILFNLKHKPCWKIIMLCLKKYYSRVFYSPFISSYSEMNKSYKSTGFIIINRIIEYRIHLCFIWRNLRIILFQRRRQNLKKILHYFRKRRHCFRKRLHCFKKRLHCFSKRLHCFKKRLHYLRKKLHCFRKIIRCLRKILHSLRKRLHCFKKRLHCFKKRLHCSRKRVQSF